MNKNVTELILGILEKKGQVTTSDIVKKTGFSRVYVNRFFQALRSQGKIVLTGKANRAHYILANAKAVKSARQNLLSITRLFKNDNISEDLIINRIKQETGIFENLPPNASTIVGYALSEMLNNAVEHSRSKTIRMDLKNESRQITFSVTDRGMGIFNNIREKKGLASNMEAIQDLLKGKETTAPEAHSGEGIFFTSKAADILTIQSSRKKLIFNNLLEDVFIRDVRETAGTKVNFSISIDTKKRLDDIFRQYTDSAYEFSKTDVIVRLYSMGSEYISRSQARRIVTGLDKFKTVTLDFKDVRTVGQAFADEIFRVWQSGHPGVVIIVKNAGENVDFMIKRARK